VLSGKRWDWKNGERIGFVKVMTDDSDPKEQARLVIRQDVVFYVE
jgi:hypothetical protein